MGPTHLKNMIVKLEIFPQIGMKIKHIWNHHLGLMLVRVGQNKNIEKTQGMCFGMSWSGGTKFDSKESVGKVMHGDDEKIHILPKTNIAPENGWLEDYFPFGPGLFSRDMLVFRGVSWIINLESCPNRALYQIISNHSVTKEEWQDTHSNGKVFQQTKYIHQYL